MQSHRPTPNKVSREPYPGHLDYISVRQTNQGGNDVKVKELISKMNCCSTLPVRMKSSINDPGVILAWKYQEVICGGNCTVLSFSVTNNEMVIYYKPIKDK